MIRFLIILTAIFAVSTTRAEEPAGPEAAARAEELRRSALGHMREGRYGQAARELRRAVTLAPEDLPTRLRLANALRRSGQDAEAGAALSETLERFPEEESAATAMGYYQRARGRLDESVRWFTRGSRLEGGWSNHLRLAVSYTDLGDREAMRRAAGRLRDSPYGAPLAEALEALYTGRHGAARRIAEAGLREGEDELWRSLAASLSVLTGDLDAALDHYRVLAPALIEAPPRVERAAVSEAVWVAYARERRKEPELAAALARGVLAHLQPTEEGYDWPLKKVYRMAALTLLGRTGEALDAFQQAVEMGYRSILFERIVRYREFDLFAPLHREPRFEELMGRIEADNRAMRESLRRRPPG